MTTRISEHKWKPIGVDDLEPTALCVVSSETNTLVVAGPGAGKTELLAQRANFLLTTGRCPSPRRILAISFKTDAAANLKKRVEERCGDLAARFDSMTLDAFAKSLVDRFRLGLPAHWRPKSSYYVRTEPVRADEARQWLSSLSLPSGCDRPPIQNWNDEKVLWEFVNIIHGWSLPYNDPGVGTLRRHWGQLLWREILSMDPDEPSLTFPMMNRLAAFLLRCNPKIVAALQSTYAYVFMDEFQDTTEAQWDLVLSAFKQSSTIVTAVGDDKQRIMLWAGAMSDAFERFQEAFQAKRIPLVRNYRSAPELVTIQDQIARTLSDENPTTEAAGTKADSGLCAIWRFTNAEREAGYIAQWIEGQIASGEKSPKDFCVLARQRVAQMIQPLQAALAERGLRLRDESVLQDLRQEPISRIVVDSIRLAVSQRDPEAWTGLLKELACIAGFDEEHMGPELERLAIKHRDAAKAALNSHGGNFAMIVRRVVDVMGYERYCEVYPQYAAANYFDNILEQLQRALDEDMNFAGDVSAAIDEFLGLNVIPAMSIHKSKGLEFDTVIFIGLEDSQWWNFARQPEEEKRAFFVAFSRAIRRVVFTYSELRPRPRGGLSIHQARDDIRSLYDVLLHAGVEEMSPDPEQASAQAVKI